MFATVNLKTKHYMVAFIVFVFQIISSTFLLSQGTEKCSNLFKVSELENGRAKAVAQVAAWLLVQCLARITQSGGIAISISISSAYWKGHIAK